MSTRINAIRVPAKGIHSASIIWLHGLGDSGNGWSSISRMYDLPHVKWIFPHAPTIPITVNAGMRMPGWFDITSLSDVMARQDEEGVMKSVNLIHRLIKEEIETGISSENIIVGGFSQGCAIAILSGYSYEQKLAGVAGLSGWLPLHNKFASMRTDANLNTPFFQAHGEEDFVVNFKFGEMTCTALKALGINVEFHKYESMGHEADPDELEELGKWISKRLVARETTSEDLTPQSKENLPAEKAVDEGKNPRGKV